MSKKTILVLLGFAFLFSFRLVYAGVVINEVMYDLEGTDTDKEWIEIFNSSGTAVDVTADWRFSDGASHWMNDKNPFSIPANGYIILAGNKDVFLLNHPGFSSTVIDTSMNLNNTGGTLKILDANGNAVDTVTYSSIQGANGNGKSLQKISGSWIEATPTPGIANENIPVVEPVVSSGGGSSASTITDSKPKTVEVSKIKTKILAKTLAFIGTPIEFSASTTGHSGELLNYGKYFWNFGDGDSKETKASDMAKFSHTFFYEGEYTVALEYYQNYYSESPDASDEVIIKIIPANVSISNVGDEKDFFVEISNDTDYDADISRWILSSNTKSFTFPKNTVLVSKRKMILSPKITGFSISDKDTLKLSNPQWETVFEYSTPIKLAKTTRNFTPLKVPVAEKNTETEMPDDSLETTAIKNDLGEENNLMYGIGLFAFLGLSTSAAYFIRNRKKRDTFGPIGNNFEIIDE